MHDDTTVLRTVNAVFDILITLLYEKKTNCFLQLQCHRPYLQTLQSLQK